MGPEGIRERQSTSESVSPLVLSTSFRGEKKIFVNREQYINSKIKEHLKKPSSRVSIIGPGGSGKSQLAFKAIHQYEREGIFDLVIPIYLDIGVITFDQFLLKIANKLGITQDQLEKYGDIDERKGIITYALSKKSNSLILVDNFETILYAISSSSFGTKDNAIQIKYYLDTNIPASILVTSRERVNLNKEKRIDLEGLTEDYSNKLFEELAADEQLREAYSQQQSRLKVNDMIKKTGGHPLSIEVLAKNVRGIEQVEQASEILGNYINKHEPNKRFQSLQESLGFTINKLDNSLRELLYNLILFKSPFPISAAMQIFGAKREDILDLFDRSMLTRIESDDVYGEMKNSEYFLYGLHPAIRSYLESSRRMAKNLERDYGEAFYGYYLSFLSDTYNAWSKENHIPSIVRFNIIAEFEYNDFDRAIELSSKENLKVGVDISRWLALIFQYLGRLTASLPYHKKSLAIHKKRRDEVEMAADYKNIGLVLNDMGKYQQALNYLHKARSIHKKRRDEVGMAADYNNIGIVLDHMAKYQQALDYHKKSLAIDEKRGDEVGMAADYNNIGLVLSNMGKYQQALEYFHKARVIDEKRRDDVRMAADYTYIGLVLDNMGKYQQALDYHKKSLSIAETREDEVGMAADYKYIGVVLDHMGKYQQALDYHKKSLAIDEKRGDRVGMAKNYGNIGIVLNDMSRYQQALNYLHKARAIHEELGDVIGMAADYKNIGLVLNDTSRYQQALEYFHKARVIDEKRGDDVRMAADYIGLVSPQSYW